MDFKFFCLRKNWKNKHKTTILSEVEKNQYIRRKKDA